MDWVDQVDGAVQAALGAHADHLGHQLHQPAVAAIRILPDQRIAPQRTMLLDRIEGAAHRMQRTLQVTQARLTGA
ncbi:hypothetical protein [Stenotrophomonas lacuserhaii]|uniref:hypothetical protein n=1 Tax=Stenotrophomonas lacuserhaii TaxID=2760084 RepID=UPI0032EB539A